MKRFSATFFLLCLAIFNLLSICRAQDQKHSKTTYPDLNNTVWTGVDFQGKKYTFTLQSDKTQRNIGFLKSDELSIPAGTFSVKTDPPQKMSGGIFYFVGPPGSEGHRGEERTYKIKFEWQGFPTASGSLPVHLCNFQGTLGENGIYMDYVEPVVAGIDYAALFGDTAKANQNLGALINCSGKNIEIIADWHQDAKGARAMLEEELASGSAANIAPGAYGLGEVSYSHGESMLCFVRDNLFIVGDRLTLPRSPDAEKEFQKILYKLDAAIRDEGPAVMLLRMPKTLGQIQ